MNKKNIEIQTPQNNLLVYLVQQIILGTIAIALVVLILAPLYAWLTN